MNLEELLPLMFDETIKQSQSKNGRGNSVFITYNGDDPLYAQHKGETKSLAEWARITNRSVNTLYTRHHNGWSPESVIETPVDRSKRNANAR